MLRSSFSSPAGEPVTERVAGDVLIMPCLMLLYIDKQLLAILLCCFATLLCYMSSTAVSATSATAQCNNAGKHLQPVFRP